MPNPFPLTDVSGCFTRPVPSGTRRLAWEGISFCVPANWELAVYEHPGKGVTRMEIEDEYAVRLEAEWTRSGTALNLDTIMKRYEAASKPLTVKAEEQNTIDGLPTGWYATHFVLRETHGDGEQLSIVRHDLVTVFHLSADARLFCFFLIHILPGDNENPKALTTLLAQTFEDHQDASLVPFSLFDIQFRMHRDFKLEKAAFDIGMKHMLFLWERRRLFLWVFSCADVFLSDDMPPEQWAVGYLNSYSGIKGPIFRTQDGAIRWRRSGMYWPGHYHELFRGCLRYEVLHHWNRASNQLWLAVFHHRRQSDLEMLPAPADAPV